ncbi:hypothetical protein [Sphingomonas sp.]|uniref:hypothetical protein n=1 Tax=Sphingomonas sp. TaxID=28214 RepID=UPI001D43A961|nr:hypothetical protein [Sphingomonas sp.]MBX9796163.1 hypothetical protein [Sphingomonas sp.]
MNILIALAAALLAIFVLVKLVQLAFGLIVLGMAVGVGIAAYHFVTRMMEQRR